MSFYADPNIKNTERIFPEQGRSEYLRLDMNENPTGLPSDFVDDVKKKITPEFLSTYPEPDEFRKKYAGYIGAKPENIMLGNGTDAILRYLLETFGEQGKDVVTVSPTFEMYRINCLLLGLNHRPVMYEWNETMKRFFVPIEKICDAINENTRVVIVTNPNNPMTDAYEREDFLRIVDRAEAFNAVVICDEAYHYFCESTMRDVALERKNVILTRTFSKLMSIPALRLGVAIGDPEIIKVARQSQLSFDVNAVALLFGEELLGRADIVEGLIESEREGRKYLVEELKEEGYEYIAGEANYVLIKTKKDPKEVERLLREKKILIHTYGSSSVIKDYLRVTTGSKDIMARFLIAFLEADQGTESVDDK